MSCFYSAYTDTLMLRCDVCRKTVSLYKGETDRLLKHDYMKENGWRCQKKEEKWMDFCPDCIAAMEQRRREKCIEQEETK